MEYKLTSETANGPNPLAITFEYDNVGNRMKRFDNGNPTPTQNFIYDADDRIVTLNGMSFLYDVNGNTLADEGNSYTWDLENRMLSATGGGHSLGNSYDGDGMRLASVADGVGTQYVMDPNTTYYRVLEERTPPPPDLLNVAHTYGEALLKQSIGPSFYHGDAIGSTRTLSGSPQAVTDTYAYEAFGTLLVEAGTTPNKYLFAGEEFSPLSGTYNLRARWYRPSQGRFLSIDPLRGQVDDPLSLNSYAYARESPLGYADPSGNQGLEASVNISVLGTLSMLPLGIVPGAVLQNADASVCVREFGPTDWLPDFLPKGRHCFIKLAYSKGASGPKTFGLYRYFIKRRDPFNPNRRQPYGCGNWDWDNPSDLVGGQPRACKYGDFPCFPREPFIQNCFDREMNNYPVGQYVLLGPNSNTFAKTIFSKCCLNKWPDPPEAYGQKSSPPAEDPQCRAQKPSHGVKTQGP